MLKGLGYRFRTLTSLNKPLGKLNSQVRALYLGLCIPQTIEEAKYFFESVGLPKHPLYEVSQEHINYATWRLYEDQVKAVRAKLDGLLERVSVYANPSKEVVNHLTVLTLESENALRKAGVPEITKANPIVIGFEKMYLQAL
jgi:hypothetical protein